jgi:large subunit ribosomal protein L23
MNLNINDVLVKPLITEKNTMLGALNKYTFKVDPRANKTQIKAAVQTIFKVDVTKVNTISVPPKTRRVGRSVGKSSPWKKAVVTVREGQRIEIFEGV